MARFIGIRIVQVAPRWIRQFIYSKDQQGIRDMQPVRDC